MEVIRITIEIQQIEVESDNPFMAIGKRLKREEEIKKSYEIANKAIEQEQILVVNKLADSIYSKLVEAGIGLKRNRVAVVHSYPHIPKEINSYVYVNDRYILFKLRPFVKKEGSHVMLTGEYKMYFSIDSNSVQLNYGNAEGWKEFTEQRELEEEIVKFYN